MATCKYEACGAADEVDAEGEAPEAGVAARGCRSRPRRPTPARPGPPAPATSR